MLKPARTKERDPEGRMPLAEHLRELRNRLAKALLAIVAVTVVAAFFYEAIINLLTGPILDSIGCDKSFAELAEARSGAEPCAQITINGLLGPFTLALKVSLTAGIVLASPVWLYQLWAFVAPGLHRNEKKYAYAFVATGAPLFLIGAYFAYAVLPTSAEVLIEFTPSDVDNLLPLDELLDLVTRMVIVFGLSFELPLLLVMLNLTGVLTGRRMLGWWRAMIMGITLFAAIATPSTDPLTMILLAGPIWVLYFGAVAVSLVNDRRRARREALEPDDDEASNLDLSPESIGEVEAVTTARALPEQATRDRVNGYDDVT
ncbi:twin-arginine translocase subunit TatC [Streptomyces parvulus]|uniref:twin-arginine translocase subunit TatC n=1 Tax=Streptomyces parvulus TaxID=146923 RepID=UPI001E297A66|nr:twin-arginine translocase subunit TatC [Streptomyces parvulus]MCC9153308.1 twin-arginine translocase subunit TatC [Streptomyces parvulus]MCE7686609.1 twin-arginine translocase subunit TatC [Streptomyces parvulus]